MLEKACAHGLVAACLWVATAATAQPAVRSYAVVSEVEVGPASFRIDKFERSIGEADP